MSLTIGVAGKGGVGKTTLAGLLVRHMVAGGHKPVLAIDADPNANLNEVLDLEVADTLGNTSEEMLKGDVPTGMGKHDYLAMRAEQCIVESKGADLLVMGRPEGPGCYCFANNVLRDIINRIGDNYPYLVIDNEAGLEHLSRRIMRKIDHLIVVSDPTVRGLQAAGRVNELVEELGISVGRISLVITRVHDELPAALDEHIESTGIPLLATLAEDPVIRQFDSEGRPLLELPEDSPTVKGVAGIAAEIGLDGEA